MPRPAKVPVARMSQCGAPLVALNSSRGEPVVDAVFGEHVRQRVHVRDAVRRDHEHVFVGAETRRAVERGVRILVARAGEREALRRTAVVEDRHAVLLDRQRQAVDLAGLAHLHGREHTLGREQVERAALVVGAPAPPVGAIGLRVGVGVGHGRSLRARGGRSHGGPAPATRPLVTSSSRAAVGGFSWDGADQPSHEMVSPGVSTVPCRASDSASTTGRGSSPGRGARPPSTASRPGARSCSCWSTVLRCGLGGARGQRGWIPRARHPPGPSRAPAPPPGGRRRRVASSRWRC